MNSEIYDLYTKCFPNYPIKESLFILLLAPEKAHIICKRVGNKLIGFSMIHGNSISLLCVDEHYRNNDIGTELLKLSEKFISNTRADKIILGRGRYYLLQGVPHDDNSVVPFFEHRGYLALWTSVNMCLSLNSFQVDNIIIPPCPGNVKFRFISRDKMHQLLNAVEDAESGWLGIFQDCADPIFIAESNGIILGFEILSPYGGRFIFSTEQVGCVGCVGVINKARNKGIGRQMVVKGIEWLKNQGCTSVELRYVELVDWYKKIGFEIIRHQWMGEKDFVAK